MISTATTTNPMTPSTTPSSTTTTNTTSNPLKDDPQLRQLLVELDQIDTKKQFRRWRTSFLQHLETFVDDAHCQPAQARYAVFTESMTRLSKLVKKLYGHLEAGHLSQQDRVTVRARKCLSDLQQQLEVVNQHLFGMLPKTAEQERNLGYNKFHLGT